MIGDYGYGVYGYKTKFDWSQYNNIKFKFSFD